MILFLRQLSALLGGGVPLSRCLDALCQQGENPAFQAVVEEVAGQVHAGHAFSNALARHPETFPPVMIVMVRIGEQTGGLEESLEQLCVWMERDFKTAQRLRSALTYPLFIAILAVLLTLGLFYTVVPSFATVFEDMDADLPWLTRMVIGFTHLLRNPGFWLLVLAAAGILFKYARRVREQPSQQRFFFVLAGRIPLVGPILNCGCLARYASAMQALLSSGLDLIRSVTLSARASKSPMLIYDSEALGNAIREGDLVSSHMVARPDIYDPTLVHLFVAGEESSRLPEMLNSAADLYESEMNCKVDALGAALEPIMLCLVAIMVGTVILSVFLPLYSCLNKIA